MSHWWQTVKLGEVITRGNSGSTPRGGAVAYHSSGTPLIRSMNVHFQGFSAEGLVYLDDCQAAALSSAIVSAGDVLLNITGASIGRVTISPDSMNGARVNQHVFRMTVNDFYSAKYLRYYLQSPEVQRIIFDDNYGVTRQALTKEMILDFDLPLPPLPEQHRIVERIEALLAKGARAKAALDALPPLLDRYRQSLLAAAFRGDFTAASIKGNLRSEPDELGERPEWLPDHWGWTTFGELASVTGGLTKNSKRNDLPIERPYLRVANVYADELRLDDIQTIQLSGAELNRVLLQPDDLLIVEGNGSLDQIGRVARWTGEVPDCVHQNHIIKARPRETWRSEYLLLWLLSPQGRLYIERQASSSSGLHTLSLSKVMRLPVPILTRQEAMLLVARVRQGLESIDALRDRLLTATSQHTTLTQSILAKAFRGEMVPQDPADEPASVLLERIRAERVEKPKRTRRGTAV